VGKPKGRRLFEGDLNLLYRRLLQANVRNPIGQGFGQVVMRFFHQSDDLLFHGAVIHRVFETIACDCRPQIRPESEINQYVLFLAALFVAYADNAAEHQVLYKDAIHIVCSQSTRHTICSGKGLGVRPPALREFFAMQSLCVWRCGPSCRS